MSLLLAEEKREESFRKLITTHKKVKVNSKTLTLVCFSKRKETIFFPKKLFKIIITVNLQKNSILGGTGHYFLKQ
jgi:hypothetical protein